MHLITDIIATTLQTICLRFSDKQELHCLQNARDLKMRMRTYLVPGRAMKLQTLNFSIAREVQFASVVLVLESLLKCILTTFAETLGPRVEAFLVLPRELHRMQGSPVPKVWVL